MSYEVSGRYCSIMANFLFLTGAIIGSEKEMHDFNCKTDSVACICLQFCTKDAGLNWTSFVQMVKQTDTIHNNRSFADFSLSLKQIIFPKYPLLWKVYV